jgi:hypothetical protein
VWRDLYYADLDSQFWHLNKAYAYLVMQQDGGGLGGVWFEELKFNQHCSTFVLFDKKFSIWD